MHKEPSILEVLYPPKEAGTRTYVPKYVPIAERVILSESEKFYGTMNSILKGIGLLMLLPVIAFVLGFIGLLAL